MIAGEEAAMSDASACRTKSAARQRNRRSWTVFAFAAGVILIATAASGQSPAPLAPGPPAAPTLSTSASPVPPAATAPLLLLNERHPLPGMLTGGIPAGEGPAAAFQALADAGVRTYIDLRADAEIPPETAALATTAGLDYRRLPIAGEADLDLASARALDLVLDEWGRYPIAVACSSGNRAGALLALRAFWLDRVGAESALELGLAAGLTRFEPSVRLLLGLPPMPPPSPTPIPPAADAHSPAADGSAKPPKPPKNAN